MSRPRNPIPTPRPHKGAAVINVYEGGKRRTLTLGPWGSQEAQQEYERVLARLRVAPSYPAGSGTDLTVSELLLSYIEWAASYYRDENGNTARSVENLKF